MNETPYRISTEPRSDGRPRGRHYDETQERSAGIEPRESRGRGRRAPVEHQ